MSFRILRVAPLLILCTSLSWAQPINLPGWQEGYLDIHHISTGSGNAAFLIFPDGTNMLFDAGDVDREARLKYPNPLKVSPHLPDESVSAAQCIATYIREVLPTISHIDYVVISHFHSDHFGSAGPRSKLSKKGDYRLSGITEVNELIPIKKLIDRAYPTYQFPFDLRTHIQDKESFSHYLKFIHSQIDAHRLSVESLKAGSNLQIIQTINSKKYPDFVVQNIKANGEIWSGKENSSINMMAESISLADYNENTLSLALKVSYGKFDYFTGGDMTGLQGFGLPIWFDMETPVAKVVGKIEALSLNHHGV